MARARPRACAPPPPPRTPRRSSARALSDPHARARAQVKSRRAAAAARRSPAQPVGARTSAAPFAAPPGVAIATPMAVPSFGEIALPESSEERLRVAVSYASTIKCMCIIDGLLNTIYTLAGAYYYVASIVMVASGYYGTRTFQNKYIACYTLYLPCNILVNLLQFFFLNDVDALLLFRVFIDCWILQVTNKFRRLLMALPQADLERLRQGFRPDRIGTVWY